MSVLVPNQRTMWPRLSRIGTMRVRNGRKTPSAPLSGKVMSNGSPVASELLNRSSTAGSTAGSWTDCQPQPSISCGVVPVYSYQRSLYQKIQPSGSAIQASCGIELARVRNCCSRSAKAASARLRSEMSSATTLIATMFPSASRKGYQLASQMIGSPGLRAVVPVISTPSTGLPVSSTERNTASVWSAIAGTTSATLRPM